jgi:uncharacterized protein YyaL (SSP411 family)
LGQSNRLAQETSPYLRQHADNPVDWYPWGQEALERARREGRPILLSVGYSACHWCHVMAHESFEDAETAKLMNEYFVNIKVDREERPDLDQLYQGVMLLLGRGGGWPLTVFLTPELKPFFGGTYFPPEDRHGIPAFKKVLLALHQAWETTQKDIQQQAQQFEAGLRHLASYGLDSSPSDWDIKDITAAAHRLERNIDRAHGGFGGAPKFPNPSPLAVLLRGHRRSGSGTLFSAVRLTLDKMARGGMYDQLGGGFHRYSVDERWSVPHFEKMLYDNAQLIHLYSEAYQLEPRPLWKEVVAQTVDYLKREMTSPEGGFYSAQDADTEGAEGKFFVWTRAEVRSLLSAEEAEWTEAHFGITDAGNFEHGQTVLEVKVDLKELAQQKGRTVEEVRAGVSEAKAKLFAARLLRPTPSLDDKILAGWNGMMIRGLSLAGRAFERDDFIDLARGAADFMLQSMWTGEVCYRSFQGGVRKIEGFLEDYGGLSLGLLSLFQATGEAKYFDASERIARRAIELFWDESKQAYFASPREQKDLLCVPYALTDNAVPSGASMLTEALVGLGALSSSSAFLEQAGKYLRRMKDEMVRNPFSYGHLLLAADALLDGGAVLALVGETNELQPMLALVNGTYLPTVAVFRQRALEDTPEALKSEVQARPALAGKGLAYLCKNFSCGAPASQPSELKAQLAKMAAVPVTAF